MRYGYACINMTLQKNHKITTNRSMIKRTFAAKGIDYASELAVKNTEDLVIATGVMHSVKYFINLTAKKLDMSIKWQGSGEDEFAIETNINKIIIKVDKKYFRPSEVNELMGDARKAEKKC